MNRNQQKRLTFVGIIFTISIFGLVMVINNFRDNLVFFYTPVEIVDNQALIKKINHKTIRVGGLVKEKSVARKDALVIEFVITDHQQELLINHKGIVPDLFRDQQGVVAKGYYSLDEKKFYSQELLIKHDENYIPYELKNIQKKPDSKS
jgi:cytochrome c-type biogenesis protein CcmE